jgi:hypothetical protein
MESRDKDKKTSGKSTLLSEIEWCFVSMTLGACEIQSCFHHTYRGVQGARDIYNNLKMKVST